MSKNLVTLRIWGDFACFTRPEMKVERVSYPVITPSAARGILESIFWEPQMYYVIDSVRIVKKGTWISVRRNEVTEVIKITNAANRMRVPQNVKPIRAGGGAEDAVQRNMLALRNVEYLLTAEVRISAQANRPGDTLEKYCGEIERRATQGKCFCRPALGMREFAADFEWEQDPAGALRKRLANLGRSPGQVNEDLGLILYDVFDPNLRDQGFRWLPRTANSDQPAHSGRMRAKSNAAPAFAGRLLQPNASFFHAHIIDSFMDCHPDRVKILTNDQRNA